MSNNTLKSWLQLFRAPNLFTVPGDPVAGFFLASWLLNPVQFENLHASLFLPVAVSLCAYMFGLLLNDLADFDEDLAERPSRPLPSGAVKKNTVRIAAASLALAALLLASRGGVLLWIVGSTLLAMIASYDLVLKKIAAAGPLAMGSCRGLSMLLGAAVAAGPVPVRLCVAVAMTVCYVAAVTHLARFETKTAAPSLAKWLPLLVLALGFFSFSFEVLLSHWLVFDRTGLFIFPEFDEPTRPENWLLFVVFFLFAIIAAAIGAIRLAKNSAQPVAPVIGSMIRGLLFMQAAFCASSVKEARDLLVPITLLALWPVSRIIGKRFYAS